MSFASPIKSSTAPASSSHIGVIRHVPSMIAPFGRKTAGPTIDPTFHCDVPERLCKPSYWRAGRTTALYDKVGGVGMTEDGLEHHLAVVDARALAGETRASGS